MKETMALPQAPMAQDPAAVPAAPEQTGSAVTITKLPDGTFTVAPETDDAAMTPETPGMESQEESSAQPAATIDEALDLARQMLDGGGEMSPEQAFSDSFEGKAGY